jgi:hypothetical protein
MVTRLTPRGVAPYNMTVEIPGDVIEQVNTNKILSLTFDSKLTWNKHIEETKAKGMQKLNIIRYLAGTTWVADQKILLNAYKAIETAYGSAINKTLLQLETVQSTELGQLWALSESQGIQTF